LMIALAVIMSNEVLYGCPQRLLAEEDHAIQTGLLDAAHKSFRVGVQIWRSRGSFTDFTPISVIVLRNSAVNSGSRS
jgi:hypothetical protein